MLYMSHTLPYYMCDVHGTVLNNITLLTVLNKKDIPSTSNKPILALCAILFTSVVVIISRNR